MVAGIATNRLTTSGQISDCNRRKIASVDVTEEFIEPVPVFILLFSSCVPVFIRKTYIGFLSSLRLFWVGEFAWAFPDCGNEKSSIA